MATGVLFLIEASLNLLDGLSGTVFKIISVPVASVLGAALMMLVIMSWLNWKFKKA